MKTQFTVDYFIEKFKAIPEEKWGMASLLFDGKSCAYGHCGLRENADIIPEEALALSELFKLLPYKADIGYGGVLTNSVWNINDAMGKNLGYPQETPKQRILAALYDIKKLQEKEEVKPVIEYRTVVIDSKVKELTETKLQLS